MKAPVLGLVVATAAFAGSSVYFRSQLNQERERAAQVAQTTRQLNARIAELEKARDELEQRRMANTGVITGSFSSFGTNAPVSAKLVPAAPADDKTESAQNRVVWSNAAAPRSPAFEKMMRSQMRANIRRQYSDVGDELGLGKEKAAKLVELLAEQQTSMFTAANEAQNAPFDWEQHQREQEMEIANLIGPDKAQALKEYQQTLPARSEADMIARQLEDNGVPLNAEQRKDLTKAVVAERARAPMPEFREGMDHADYMKSINDWKTDYDKRIADEASHIFNSEQLSAYNDIQQWQRDLQEQFASSGMQTLPMPTGARVRRMMVPAGAVAVSAAPAAYYEATVVNGVEVQSERTVTGEDPKKP
jgi:hypothetical protein